MLAFVFPGQGSQVVGMGRGLFDEIGEFRAVEAEVDSILGYSLRKLCLEDRANRLRETEYTQPCLYTVNSLYYYKEIRHRRPRFVAGHSLGEYNALLAGGAFDFLTGLRLVQARGKLMAEANSGGMVAVVGISARYLANVLRDSGLDALDIASYNAPTQTTVSGPVVELEKARPLFAKAGATMVIPLPVSAAFHSRYMEKTARKFGEVLRGCSLRPLQLPVISNVTGEPYPQSDPSEAIRPLLVKQVTHPVQWTKSVRSLVDAGVVEFKEVGPGAVLSRLIQEIRRN
jgi:malonyl CoA-acyl carrier protein transacylase